MKGNKMQIIWSFVILSSIFGSSVFCLLDEGKWDLNLTNESSVLYLPKSLYKGAQAYVYVHCDMETDQNLTVIINVVPLKCWDYLAPFEQAQKIIEEGDASVFTLPVNFRCNEHINIDAGKFVTPKPPSAKAKRAAKTNRAGKTKRGAPTHSIYTAPVDGFYILIIQVLQALPTLNFTVTIHAEMRSDYGYLSAADWPLLPFYGFMCAFYVALGVLWLVFSFLQWRDLLRVQFWIGGVIFLGMLEKATFYAEFQSLNNSGVHTKGAMLFAEWVSCAKRTLARMLVIIVSLGFGIVKPRLGAALHRVVGVGLLYFFLATSEAYLRIIHPKNDHSKDLLVASIPLAVLDSAICWWIFSALVNTTRTLRLRRNETKLALYRHFTNTLIFAVVASVFFMLYSIKTHRMVNCLAVWKDLWLDEGYWHILFSALLLVIMILWRPTNNNQRYAFVPLLDTEDDEEEAQLVHDAYGVKVRIHNNKPTQKNHSVDDDLQWLNEHIQSDPALPILDSDEEIANTRFEVSKMQ